MKIQRIATLLLLLAAGRATAQTQDKPADVKTLSGQVLKQAHVSRVEPDGITYFYAGGVSKIPFTDLPVSVRQQYGYDPAKAAAFSAADDQVQAVAFAQVQAAQNAAVEHKADVIVASQQSTPPLTASAAKTPHVGLPQTSSLNNVPVRRQATLKGTVLSVDEEAGVLIVSCDGTPGMIGAESVDGTVAIKGYKEWSKINDGDLVNISGREAGSYSYGAVSGAKKKVRAFTFESGRFTTPSGLNIR